MSSATFIVYEKSGLWARVFRHRLVGKSIPVQEVRNKEACHDLLREAPKSLIALELSRDPLQVDRAMGQILSLRAEFPGMRWLVMADRELEKSEPQLRELGADHFIASTLRAGEIIDIVERHLKKRGSVLSTRLVDILWKQIPWANQS